MNPAPQSPHTSHVLDAELLPDDAFDLEALAQAAGPETC